MQYHDQNMYKRQQQHNNFVGGSRMDASFEEHYEPKIKSDFSKGSNISEMNER
jgi:hypothetical protein